MITYTPAPQGHETLMAVEEQVALWHAELQLWEVTVGVDLAAVPVDEKLKAKGRACHAYIKITPVRQRQRGIPDAVITVDYTYYMTLTPEQQAGLIDHELTHLKVFRDAKDNVEADAAGRPTLEMVEHDIEVGWFMVVADRHGENSHEVMQARQIQERHGQTLFSFAEGPIPRIALSPAPESAALDEIVEATKSRRKQGKS